MKQLKLFSLFLAFMAMGTILAGCDDDDDDSPESPSVELVGGCWIYATSGYSEMLTFEDGGFVTSNGVADDNTWEVRGTYTLENGKLTFDFNGEKREGDFQAVDEDLFTFVEDGVNKNFNRRYPPKFEDINGWVWGFQEAMLVPQAAKDVYTSPTYDFNGTPVVNEYSVSELIEKVQTGFLDPAFATVRFEGNHFYIIAADGTRKAYPFTYLGDDIVSINFGTAENPCNIAVLIKLFAVGKIALCFVDESSYSLLALNDLNMLGIEADAATFEAWKKSYADTFDQLLLVVSYNMVPK